MNKIILTIKDFFEIPSARIYNPDSFKPIEAVSIDSRHIPAKGLFIAIKGEKFDGHNFVMDALSNGASAIMVSETKFKKFSSLSIPVITVEDTVKALGYLAAIWRTRLGTKIIGITGSAGKTSVKEYIALLLREKYSVNRTLANHNNHIGVPLTLFSTNNKHDYLVLELGTNHFGEIAYTAGIASPDMAVITNIGNSHLEFLKNRKGVLKEKVALFAATKENNGTLFINNDDKALAKIYPEYPRRITYAIDNRSDVKGKIEKYTEDGRAIISIAYKGKKFTAELPVWGDQAAKNFICAAAIAIKAGVGVNDIIRGTNKLKAYDKRFIVKELNGIVVIDDTYNANPDSMANAITMLRKLYPSKTKVAVLGDMLELGVNSSTYHKKVAGFIRKNKIDKVYTIGSMSANIYDQLKGTSIKARHFVSRTSLKRFLQRQDFNGSVILFKGSRGMRMEEFLKVIEDKVIS